MEIKRELTENEQQIVDHYEKQLERQKLLLDGANQNCDSLAEDKREWRKRCLHAQMKLDRAEAEIIKLKKK